MPLYPGEERVITLFADIHYYFAKPEVRPLIHRFDKGSYFYIYYNATRQTSRIEIANNPGTPYQDAFNGYLDKCRITNSREFPTRVTVEAEAEGVATSPSSRIPGRDPEEWRLESGDLRETGRFKHKLHTIDLYFWTQPDAQLAVEFFKKLLYPVQLNMVDVDEPTPASTAGAATGDRTHDVVSPVVQNLEKVAISDPAYQNGQTRNSRSQPQLSHASDIPPPPAAASNSLPASQTKSNNEGSISADLSTSGNGFTPLAYNPAAPAAPEPIKHREKTPPPADGAEGTGLTNAAVQDQAYQPRPTPAQTYAASSLTQPGQIGHYGSPPPAPSLTGYGPPPPASSGYGSPPAQTYPTRSSVSSTTPSFGPPPTQPTPSQDSHRGSIAADRYTPADVNLQPQSAETPSSEFYKNLDHHESYKLRHNSPRYPDVLEQQGQAQSQSSPQPPGYGQTQQYGQHPGSIPDPGSIHSQIYIPEDGQSHGFAPHGHGSHGSQKKQSSQKSKGGWGSKLTKFAKGAEGAANRVVDRVEGRMA